MVAEGADILVVLPTLGRRLDSLQKALDSAIASQQRRVRVVLVVPKEASEAAKLARLRGAEVVSDPGRGMSAAINAGLAARSDEQYYIWLGDDDLYRPGGLATLAKLLDSHPDAVVAHGACDYVADDGSVLWVSRAGVLARRIIGFGPNLIPHPAAMMRLDALERVGGYDEGLKLAMDLDVLLRLRREGRFVSTTAVVSAFGWHPGSLTVADRRASAAEARTVKRRFLPRWMRWAEPLWEYPVAWASQIAASRLNRRGNSERNH